MPGLTSGRFYSWWRVIPQLRDYQADIAAKARAQYAAGMRAPLVVSPTGSGKTILFSYMTARAAEREKRVGVLCHRVELLEQISGALRRFEVPHGIVAPGYVKDRGPLVQVASVFTLANRIADYRPFDLLIIDEAHHAIPGSTWGKVIEANPDALLLGVTATPERLGGQGLGETFDTMVMGPSTRSLIEQGWLAPYRLFAPPVAALDGVHTRSGDYVRGELAAAVDKPKITGDAVDHYTRLARGKRAIVFCVSVAHAVHVAEQFRAAGVQAQSIDGGMERCDRARLTGDFANGRLQVITSCDLLGEGYDVAGIECAILLRPTQSLALHLQQVGRALRICDGKSEAILLDHAGNTARHGLPDDEREWSLEGRPRGKRGAKKDDAIAIKTCGKCFCTVRAMLPICPHCGTPFPVQAREVAEVDGDLVEVDPEVARRQRRIAQASCLTLEELIEHGRARKMANPRGWAMHVLRNRGQKTRRAA